MDILSERFRDYFNPREHRAVYGDILAWLSYITIILTAANNTSLPLSAVYLLLGVVIVFFIVIWTPVRIVYFVAYLVAGPERLSVFSKRVLVGKDAKAKKAVKQKVSPGSGYVPAGFWIRLVARAIDAFLTGVVYVILLFVIVIFVKIKKLDYTTALLMKQILFILYSIFFLSIDSTMPGKAFLGIKVTDTKGKRITAKAAAVRSFSTILSAFFGLGYLMILSDEEKHRALHDRIAGTLVVKRADAPKTRLIIVSIVAVLLYLVSFGQLLVAYHIKFPKSF